MNDVEEIAKANFSTDKAESSGGLVANGHIYTKWEELPESIKELYRIEAKLQGKVESRATP